LETPLSATAYAGTPAGIFRTANDGTSWEERNVGLKKMEVLSLTTDSAGRLFAGTQDGLFRSAGFGQAWQRLDLGVPDPSVVVLDVAPGATPVLYAAIRPTIQATAFGLGSSAVLKSTDAGEHWEHADGLLPNPSVSDLAIDPVSPTTVYASLDDSVYKTLDGGEHWASASDGLDGGSPYSLAIDPASPSTLYATMFDSFVSWMYKTVDGGDHWEPLPDQSVLAYQVEVDPRGGIVYVVATSGILRSSDGGASWVPLNVGLPSQAPDTACPGDRSEAADQHVHRRGRRPAGPL
jgi:photosystem II stability/assembly factor-like uncharacterized protein